MAIRPSDVARVAYAAERAVSTIAMPPWEELPDHYQEAIARGAVQAMAGLQHGRAPVFGAVASALQDVANRAYQEEVAERIALGRVVVGKED